MNNTLENAELRQFISNYFNETELDTFCFDYFWEVEFTSNMTLTERTKTLILHCRRRDLIPNLLEKLEKERPQQFKNTFFFNPDILAQDISQNEVKLISKPNSFVQEKTGLEFVCIPSGEFLYGDNELETIYLPEYWISTTPVTNQVYQKFINANPDYPVPFAEADAAMPYNWDSKTRSFPIDKKDHPVVLVNWYDAAAFTEWARLRLPTEQEWEKAARGTDGWKYPWGNEWRESHCNSSEMGLGKTSFVGKYSPQGNSPFGCIDMSGNVWEWTASLYIEYRSDRVVRGGSWHSNAHVARRSRYPTANFNTDRGFRVISPIIPSLFNFIE